MNSEPLAVLVGCIYLCAAVIELNASRYGYGVMWFSYGLANVGLIMSMRHI